MQAAEELLRHLASGDERWVQEVVALTPSGRSGVLADSLTPKVRMLVRLGALVALNATTTSLNWAVEAAACARADVDEITGVLGSIGAEIGTPAIVSSAPRLALSLGFEVEGERA